VTAISLAEWWHRKCTLASRVQPEVPERAARRDLLKNLKSEKLQTLASKCGPQATAAQMYSKVMERLETEQNTRQQLSMMHLGSDRGGGGGRRDGGRGGGRGHTNPHFNGRGGGDQHRAARAQSVGPSKLCGHCGKTSHIKEFCFALHGKPKIGTPEEAVNSNWRAPRAVSAAPGQGRTPAPTPYRAPGAGKGGGRAGGRGGGRGAPLHAVGAAPKKSCSDCGAKGHVASAPLCPKSSRK
jgi:hypothetical protein